MRNITITSTISTNHKRKNLCIIESIKEKGVRAIAEKKFKYYVSEKISACESDAIQWVGSHGPELQKKGRRVSIQKIVDPATGAASMVYRVIGSFYVVQNLHVFAVVFLHSVKFNLPGNLTSDSKLQIPPDLGLDINSK